MQILKSLAASPLATTATFLTFYFCILEADHSSLVASPASFAQVVIEISTEFMVLTYASVFLATGSVSSNCTGIISLPFTVSSVVLPITIAAPTVTFLSLLLSRLGLDIGVG